jgi:hypothetical protein
LRRGIGFSRATAEQCSTKKAAASTSFAVAAPTYITYITPGACRRSSPQVDGDVNGNGDGDGDGNGKRRRRRQRQAATATATANGDGDGSGP